MALWGLFRRTDWKHFFSKNGTGEIVWEKVSGWREQPNDLCSVLTVTGMIKGGPRGEGMYAAWNTDYTEDTTTRALSQDAAVSHFESYALPDCRCRLGLHWKCGIHKNWRG